VVRIAGIIGVCGPVAPTLIQCFAAQGTWGVDFIERGSYMSEFRSTRAVLAGAAIVALAGCTASGNAGTPQVSTGVGTSSHAPNGAASAASSAARSNGATSSATSNSFVGPGSIPFPVAVGDTWVYQVTAGSNGEKGLATDKIVSAVPTSGGYRVTMSQTIDVAGATTTTQPVYIFYSNGTIGYPVTEANGVSVAGNGVLWPDAADLASGQAFHTVLRILVSQSGSSRLQNANVTVQGEGTASVTVPAGTYQATVVVMTIGTSVGVYNSTVEVKTWVAPGLGPVKSEVLVLAAGKTTLLTTQELLSFTKGAARADGS
jgi:hypothetical protein